MVRFRLTIEADDLLYIYIAPNRKATIADHMADNPNSKLHPRLLGPYPVRKVTVTTVKVNGTYNVSINRLIRVTGVSESQPRLRVGPPLPLCEKDEIVDFKTSRRRTMYKVKCDDHCPTSWDKVEDLPADVFFEHDAKAGTQFLRAAFDRYTTSTEGNTANF